MKDRVNSENLYKYINFCFPFFLTLIRISTRLARINQYFVTHFLISFCVSFSLLLSSMHTVSVFPHLTYAFFYIPGITSFTSFLFYRETVAGKTFLTF